MKNISDDDTHHPPPSKNLQASSLGLIWNIDVDDGHQDGDFRVEDDDGKGANK